MLMRILTMSSALVAVGAIIGFSLWQAHLADGQHQDDRLETHIGNMQDLPLNHHLSASIPGGVIRQVAREQTLTAADLSGADIIQPQLDKFSSCRNTMLSTGLSCLQVPIVKLSYWYTESNQEKGVIGKLINQFERQNPGIKIHAVQEPFSQTRAAFTTAMQDGNAPDVLRSDVGWTTLFASKGYLLNIDSYVSRSDLS